MKVFCGSRQASGVEREGEPGEDPDLANADGYCDKCGAELVDEELITDQHDTIEKLVRELTVQDPWVEHKMDRIARLILEDAFASAKKRLGEPPSKRQPAGIDGI